MSDLERRRDAVLREIAVAFAGVRLGDGTSWRQTIVDDRWGRAKADTDEMGDDENCDWIELADDPYWPPNEGEGGWRFMDPLGFRFYLPALMTVVARTALAIEAMGHTLDTSVCYHLTLPLSMPGFRRRGRPARVQVLAVVRARPRPVGGDPGFRGVHGPRRRRRAERRGRLPRLEEMLPRLFSDLLMPKWAIIGE